MLKTPRCEDKKLRGTPLDPEIYSRGSGWAHTLFQGRTRTSPLTTIHAPPRVFAWLPCAPAYCNVALKLLGRYLQVIHTPPDAYERSKDYYAAARIGGNSGNLRRIIFPR